MSNCIVFFVASVNASLSFQSLAILLQGLEVVTNQLYVTLC